MPSSIDSKLLLSRLIQLGDTGRDMLGRLCRLTGTDEDKAGRDLLCTWLKQAGLEVRIDRVGNIYGFWAPVGSDGDPVVIGSHIDTVVDAGIYDGCYGVLAGLSVIEALQDDDFRPSRPIAVVAFTNEEGVRFSPHMTGSLVAVGGLSVDDALILKGRDGSVLGDELANIGYAGEADPGLCRPHAYLELHIEQGPVLEAERLSVGVVDGVQGISCQRITILGTANHAGTTPMHLRRDPGIAAARLMTHLNTFATLTPGAVATVGTIRFEPNASNVIPSSATLTIDQRNPSDDSLKAQEKTLEDFLTVLRDEGYEVRAEPLTRVGPVAFSNAISALIEEAARKRQLAYRRMPSGAVHDAAMISRICPTAMIFVPSQGGISHSPAEFTTDVELTAGANILLDVTRRLSQ